MTFASMNNDEISKTIRVRSLKVQPAEKPELYSTIIESVSLTYTYAVQIPCVNKFSTDSGTSLYY